MNDGLDIAIILSALAVGFVGWRTGCIRMVIPLVGAVVGIFVAGRHYYRVLPFLPDGVADLEATSIFFFAAIAAGVFAIAVTVSVVTRGVLRVFFLGWVDSLAGLALGLGLAIVLWAGVLGFVKPFLSEEHQQAVDESQIAEVLLEDAPVLVSLVPGPVKSYVEDKIEYLQEELPPGLLEGQAEASSDQEAAQDDIGGSHPFDGLFPSPSLDLDRAFPAG